MAQDNNNTPNNITYKQMINTFSDIATNHLQIQSFNSGSLDDVDIEKLDADKFPLMYITPLPVSVDAQTLTYSFDVIIADRIQEDMADIDDAYSETLLIIKDVISNFRQATQTESWADQRTDIDLPLNLTPFTSRFANLLTGWGGTFNIVVNNENNLCAVPQTNNS
tara:strand:- start:2404 stop:2901 length:498 start_codon:yes stop_codon:yes gene_type:complete